jgi:polyisoprenoid-binding protein YceI
MGVPVEGKFGKFSAQIALDPKKPETGSVAFSIDTGSARFGSRRTRRRGAQAHVAERAQFPQASFQSSAIKAPGGAALRSPASSHQGPTCPTSVVPVQVTQAAPGSTASGSFTIKRLAFKVGEGEWTDTSMLANDVQVRFKLALTGIPPM